MRSHSDFANDLENMEINFTILFGFLIRSMEFKVFTLFGPAPAENLRLEKKANQS